jgi:hypothetical protein
VKLLFCYPVIHGRLSRQAKGAVNDKGKLVNLEAAEWFTSPKDKAKRSPADPDYGSIGSRALDFVRSDWCWCDSQIRGRYSCRTLRSSR